MVIVALFIRLAFCYTRPLHVCLCVEVDVCLFMTESFLFNIINCQYLHFSSKSFFVCFPCVLIIMFMQLLLDMYRRLSIFNLLVKDGPQMRC